ncbi:hypothetical protein BDR05DRAFT_948201 [Suillus weaverae]|nr:hypothetical protein BDR05DRAFT_948201 [Suillus weaverae]
MDFETWVAKELAYLESIALEPVCDGLAVDYIEALEKLNTYQQQFNSFRTNQFVMYLPSSFTPDSGLSIAASQTTKQTQAAQYAVEHHIQIQISIVEDLEICLEIAKQWTPRCLDYWETLHYSQ